MKTVLASTALATTVAFSSSSLASSPHSSGSNVNGQKEPVSAVGSSAAQKSDRINKAVHEADASYQNYRFRSGQTLPELRLHYATLGEPRRNASGDIENAVLVLHWTGVDSRSLLSPVYMESLFDPGRPLDAGQYFLIFPDSIGHGQSSKPSDGLKASFPNYSYSDMVDLQHKLVTETLGIKRLHAILGMSMGGMNAWQWAEAYPDAMDGIMPVVSLPISVSGRNLLWRRLVINEIENDPQWDHGNYTSTPSGLIRGYQILHMMIDGVPHLQALIPNAAAAEDVISSTTQRAMDIDANDILYSLRSSADYNPQPELGLIKAKVFALNFSDDEFNPDILRTLKQQMPHVADGSYTVQQGSAESFGHLTMAHPNLWSDHVRQFMRNLSSKYNESGSK